VELHVYPWTVISVSSKHPSVTLLPDLIYCL